MSEILLQIPIGVRASIWEHLLDSRTDDEEAAFVFAEYRETDRSREFRLLEWLAVPADGFADRSPYYFELTDEMRARIIKRAHGLGASVVELHSHGGSWPAAFSPSDLSGFREWVPHIFWRLQERPYAAVVVAAESFDGIAWIEDVEKPERLNAVVTDAGDRLTPTHRSSLRFIHDE